ncbi:WUSCHEL-related homeobox 10 [Brachypodium distachyon]|uniref:Homeobox domain-containing protein n=1 Tax=Brachypodium distachyon TaxID=15368 RepID=I1I285_BRADI|nr:WUSCHEL-related homeobox 10 [Brachypodium distachyon]KQJ95743.1 hypothetical protein BRADI_3g18800v3 [Brachypodium distachyon]|eukprot:XP_003571573.1 WUSCHEL-related homeobox 10 [Brachypodium distachyon]
MDHQQHHSQAPTQRAGCGEGAEPAARSRWAPKPEQILILESIFNSGMVNPAKDETARIRRLLERFGAVRDANVFYWFQNRRSRSRRRARQLQHQAQLHQLPSAPHGIMHYGQLSCGGGGVMSPAAAPVASAPAPTAGPHLLADVVGAGDDDLFAIPRQMGLMDHRYTETSQLTYQQPGTIQVFINGAAYDVPSAGPLDLAGTFGHDVMLVHSSGEILPVNEHGVLMKNLQMGECYYMVSRSI